MEDLELKLTHNDMDKVGPETHDLKASRKFSFSHFTQGTAFLLLSRSDLDEKRLWTKDHRRWHHLWKTGYRQCEQGTAHGPQGKRSAEFFM